MPRTGSEAVVYGGTVYVPAIQGFVPGTLDFPSEDVHDQARQAMRNLQSVLEASGSSLAQVLKITLFLTDMKDFPKVNEALNEAFPVNPPARSSIQVGALPRNGRVVVDAVAAVGAS